jgi:cytochrome c biogenesis protein ResB
LHHLLSHFFFAILLILLIVQTLCSFSFMHIEKTLEELRAKHRAVLEKELEELKRRRNMREVRLLSFTQPASSLFRERKKKKD